jgi:hypothetical protein
MCGGVIEDVVSTVDDALVGLDKTVGENIPGGWTLPAAVAAAYVTGGTSLLAEGALEAGAVATADATAAGLGYSSAAEAIAAGATTAAELGLPAATTAADLAAVSGSASAGFGGLGVEAGVAGGVPAGGTAADVFGGYSATGSAANGAASNLSTLASNVGSTASNVAGGANATTSMTDLIAQDALALKSQGLGTEQIAQTLSQSYGIDQYAASNVASMAAGGSNALQIAGVLASDYGTQMAGVAGSTSSMPSIANLVKYASTGSQLIGGLGKMFGGAQALANGRQVQPGQADPFSAYRPQYAAQLQNLMSNPNSVTQTPGYQFNLSQGLQGLQAQQAAQGRLVSGGALLQGQQFGQNLAQQSYTDQLKTLMALSGASQSPGVGATAMSNIGASNLGSTLGGWQAIAGGAGQVVNPLATLYANFNNPSPNPTV